MQQLTEPLSILNPPFPFPFTGEDDGEIWVYRNYLAMFELCPRAVAMPTEQTPIFRFQYAAHIYNMDVPTARPVVTYTLEQMCVLKSNADMILGEDKSNFYDIGDYLTAPYFFTRYLPGEHHNYGGVNHADHQFTANDWALFRNAVLHTLAKELDVEYGPTFRYAGTSSDYWELRSAHKQQTESGG